MGKGDSMDSGGETPEFLAHVDVLLTRLQAEILRLTSIDEELKMLGEGVGSALTIEEKESLKETVEGLEKEEQSSLEKSYTCMQSLLSLALSGERKKTFVTLEEELKERVRIMSTDNYIEV